MAKLSSYTKDTSITEKDKLAGSSYVGLVNGIPKYQTASYTIEDLGLYFSENITIGGSEYDIVSMYNDIQTNKTSISSINTSLTVLANEDLALAQSITTLETSFTTDLTDAVATINTSLTALSTADSALATSITELETSFTTDLSEAVATINTELTTLSTADEALATSITTLETTFTTDLATTNAAIVTEATARATADLAEATAREALETSLSTDIATVSAAVTAETLARSTEDEALALSITTLETDLTTDIATVSAAVTAETLARSTEDEALALSITTLETDLTTDIATVSAAVTAETLARSTEDEALALSITTLEADLTTDIADVSAAITAETLARTTEDEALALSITTLEADLTTDIADVSAAVTAETLARTTEDEALALSITTLEANLTNDISDVSAAITAETLARTTEDEALALSITTLESDLTNDISDVSAAVTAESLARTTADGALASDITVVEAAVEIKPNVYRQDDEPATTVPVNSIWYDTNAGNKQYVLVAGEPNVWTEVTDQRLPNTVSGLATAQEDITANTSAIQAEASKVTELQSQFTFDGENISGTADALNTSIQTAASTAAGAVATDLDKLETLFTFDGNGDISGLAPSTTISSAVAEAKTEAISAADSAAASRDTNLRVLIQTDDVAPVQAALDTAESAIVRLDGYAESKYTLTATAGNVITGMSILASSGGGAQDVSEVKFQADKFIIQSSSTTATPFVLDNDALKLNVPLNGVSGTFSGNLFAALGTNSVVNPDAYVAFGNVEVSNVGATITKNFPVLELSDDFRAIQARRAIYINTVLDDAQEFTGIRFFGTRLDANGDEDLLNKGMSIKADELRLQFFNDPGGTYVPSKIKWRDAQKVVGGPTYETEIYAEYNSNDRPYIVIDGDVRFQGNVDLGTGQIVGHPIINAGTSTSNAAGTSTVIKNIDLDGNGHVLDIENISLTLDNVTAGGNTTSNDIYVNNVIGDAFVFDTANPETALPVGGLTWNIDESTLDLKLNENVTLQVGQEEVLKVVNKTGDTLNEADFRAVRIRSTAEGGAQGQRLAVLLAQGNNDANSATTIGLVTETILNNEAGFITLSGKVNNINTTGAKSYLGLETWVDGDILYLSPTQPGYLTNVKPQAPQHTIIIGWVVYAHANNGKIFVKVDNGYEIDELHNVRVNSPAAGDLLVYNDVDFVWENKKTIHNLTMTGSLVGPSNFVIDPAIVDSDEGTVEIRGSIDVNGNANFDGNVIIDGNLTVSGTTITIEATNLSVADNMIYLNAGSSVSNPDLGFAGNYNDGTYAHTGLFRDATDGIWKFFQGYVPEPDASAFIDTAHASFALAPLQVTTLYGNVNGNVNGDLNGNVNGNVNGNLNGTASSATNADMVDNKHAEEFTLAYVTSNNNSTTNNISVGNITSGSINASGAINGKIILNKTYASVSGTAQAVVGLNAVTSEVPEDALFELTVYGEGWYHKAVMTCYHDGTLGGNWNVYLSINEGDGVIIFSSSQTNGVVTINILSTDALATPGVYVHVEYLGELNNLIQNPV